MCGRPANAPISDDQMCASLADMAEVAYHAVMNTRKLGSDAVSALGLGGMYLSIQGRPDEAQGIATIHAALDAGMTLIDTADVYCLDDDDLGHNERLIAKAIPIYTANGQAPKDGLKAEDIVTNEFIDPSIGL